jgi:hypothetical protein
MNRFLIALVAAWVVASTGLAQAVTLLDTTYDWSSDGSESDQTGRLTRNGIQSTWALPKSNPGLFSPTLQDYVVYTIGALTFDHIQVTIFQLSDSNVYSAAYSAFNPADPTANYLADAGLSSGEPPEDQFYQFVVAPSSFFDVTISTVNGTATAANGQTRILVEGFDGLPGQTPLPAAAWLFGSGLVGLTALARRRTRRAPAA